MIKLFFMKHIIFIYNMNFFLLFITPTKYLACFIITLESFLILTLLKSLFLQLFLIFIFEIKHDKSFYTSKL